MTFRFLECGLLTMVSNPLALRSDTDLERVLPVLAGQMDQLAHDDGSDFLMIRDVDPEHYQRYLDILRPLGFRPALGFSCRHDHQLVERGRGTGLPVSQKAPAVEDVAGVS